MSIPSFHGYDHAGALSMALEQDVDSYVTPRIPAEALAATASHAVLIGRVALGLESYLRAQLTPDVLVFFNGLYVPKGTTVDYPDLHRRLVRLAEQADYPALARRALDMEDKYPGDRYLNEDP